MINALLGAVHRAARSPLEAMALSADNNQQLIRQVENRRYINQRRATATFGQLQFGVKLIFQPCRNTAEAKSETEEGKKISLLVAFEKYRLPTFIYGGEGREEAPTAVKALLPATETLGKPRSATPEAASGVPAFVLQVGAMAHEENANILAESLVQRNFPAFVSKPDTTRLSFVFIGPYKDAGDTTKIKRKLEQQGSTSIRTEWKAPRSAYSDRMGMTRRATCRHPVGVMSAS